ncbi:MAG: hypothetical protein R3E66_09000 [bacterium]
MRYFILAASLVLVACSDDSTNSANNTLNNGSNNNASNNTVSNNVTNNTSNNGTTPNTNNAVGDAGLDATTPDMGVEDASLDANTSVDSGVDAAADAEADANDPYANRPLGQCAVDDDCPTNPNGKTCNRLLPGGSCGSCDAFNDLYCDDTCFNGTCITTCSTSDDCPAGLRCLGSGRCGAESCQNGVCPVPWLGCSASNLCTRVECADDPNVCPAQTTCVQGVCIEDRQVN